jgi:transcriptional regulator with XRE-family HTH domain
MTISERLFGIMEEKGVSIPELSRMTGISRHTIFDWHRKNTNPGADKIMIICEVLGITPEELLIGKEEDNAVGFVSTDNLDVQIMNGCHNLSDAKKKRLLAYVSMLTNTKE